MALLRTWDKGLIPDIERKAKIELGETLTVRSKCLEELRKLIDAEEGFCPCTDDVFLLSFLRGRKFDVKRAFKTMKNFYAYKYKYSGKLTDLRPSQLRKYIEMNNLLIPSKRGFNGEAIFIAFVPTFDLEKGTPCDLMATGMLSVYLNLVIEATQVCGVSIIYDYHNITLNQLRQWASPAYISMHINGVQDCLPVRINSIHLTRTPSYFSFAYNLAKIVLSKKMRERIHFHGDNLETLQNFFPKDVLPKELGGNLDEREFDEFRSYVYSGESFFEKFNKYMVNGKASPASKADDAEEKI